MDSGNFQFTIISAAALIVFAAYFLAGIIDAVCGGGGLITVPVLMTLGMPPHMVVGTNQCTVLPGCVVALYKYQKTGNMDFKTALISLPPALIGAFIGARLNMLVSDRYIRMLMLVLIPVLAIISLVKKNMGEEDLSDTISAGKKAAVALAIGFFVSAYHAFYGPGSGMLYMISYAMFLKYDLIKANGITRFVLACVSVVSSVTYAVGGYVNYHVLLVAIAAYMIGNYLGAAVAVRKGAGFVRPVYYAVLAGLFVKLIIDFFG